MLFSLVKTAVALGLDARADVRDVLLRIAHEPDVAKLTPAACPGRGGVRRTVTISQTTFEFVCSTSRH
jgi:hypothetical protein